MSAVLPDTTAFEELRDKKAAALANASIFADNENLPYKSYVSPVELNTLVLKDPEVAELAKQTYGEEWLNKRLPYVDQIIQKRVAPYRRAPIVYDMEERQPEYMEALRRYERGGSTRDYPGNVAVAPPPEPVGLAAQKELAALGFEPQKQYTTGDFGKDAKIRTLGGFAPRNLTTQDLAYLFKNQGIELEEAPRYVNPSKPELGILVKQKGAEDYEIFDLPYFTGADTYEFLVQEFPALAGDLALTIYGGKKFEPFMTGVGKTPLRRFVDLSKLSGLSATGAAGGDFVRLLIGSELGAHDREFDEMLKESGMIGALTFGGTLAVTAAMKGIPAIYRKITGQDVPQGFFREMDELYQKALATERGESVFPSVTYGDELSVKQIRGAIKELAELTGKEFSEYNPTIASRSGLPTAENYEQVFLKHADNPEVAALYKQLKLGNKEVIDQFINALNESVGEPLTGALVTGAEVGQGVSTLIRQDVAQIEQNAREAIDNIRKNLLETEDIATGGQALLKEVPDERISTPLFQRTRTRLAEIKEEYVKPFTEAFDSALNNPRYAEAPPTGAGFTRGPATKWDKVSSRQVDQLFRSAEASEARGLLNELLGTEGGIILKRLQGRKPVKKEITTPRGKTEIIAGGEFKSPEFTLQELNQARTVLNDFASNVDNQTAAKLARDLERGIEQQMYRYLEGGAAKESGFKIGSKELKQYMNDTGYGLDIAAAWTNQAKAIKKANSEAIQSILQREPETVVDYILSTSTPGSKFNGKMSDFMEVIGSQGGDEIYEVRRAVSQRIRQNILDQPDKTPLQIAREYRNFLKDHKGTLETVFGGDFKYYGSPTAFKNNVLKPLQKAEDDISALQARFGDIANPDPSVTNIVTRLLNVSEDAIQSGRVFADQEYLLNIVNRNPTLKKQVNQVAKSWINNKIYKPTPTGQGFIVDEKALNKLIYGGFGPEELTGLSFDDFIVPLLGKEGKKYAKNLKIFNNLVQRERGTLSRDPAIERVIKEGATPQTEYLRRFLIPPLTQTGRRLTAAEVLAGEKSRAFIGQMLLDDKLFQQTMDAFRGQLTMDAFGRFLTSYSIVEAMDLGNELKYYDTRKKSQRKGSLKEEITTATEDIITAAEGVYN